METEEKIELICSHAACTCSKKKIRSELLKNSIFNIDCRFLIRFDRKFIAWCEAIASDSVLVISQHSFAFVNFRQEKKCRFVKVNEINISKMNWNLYWIASAFHFISFSIRHKQFAFQSISFQKISRRLRRIRLSLNQLAFNFGRNFRFSRSLIICERREISFYESVVSVYADC